MSYHSALFSWRNLLDTQDYRYSYVFHFQTEAFKSHFQIMWSSTSLLTVPLWWETLRIFKILLACSIQSQSPADNGWIAGWMYVHSVILRRCQILLVLISLWASSHWCLPDSSLWVPVCAIQSLSCSQRPVDFHSTGKPSANNSWDFEYKSHHVHILHRTVLPAWLLTW